MCGATAPLSPEHTTKAVHEPTDRLPVAGPLRTRQQLPQALRALRHQHRSATQHIDTCSSAGEPVTGSRCSACHARAPPASGETGTWISSVWPLWWLSVEVCMTVQYAQCESPGGMAHYPGRARPRRAQVAARGGTRTAAGRVQANTTEPHPLATWWPLYEWKMLFIQGRPAGTAGATPSHYL
jgi:hypothetical protein